MPHILQADYDALSRGNVENWVGAHIIPVRELQLGPVPSIKQL